MKTKQIWIRSMMVILALYFLLTGCQEDGISDSLPMPVSEDKSSTPSHDMPEVDNVEGSPMPEDTKGARETIKGKILEVSEDGLRILVHIDIPPQYSVVLKTWVDITEDTQFDKGVNKDFAVDSTVAIVTDGFVPETYPMQTTALQVQQNDAPTVEPVTSNMIHG